MKNANHSGTTRQAGGTTITATSDVSCLRHLKAEAAAAIAANATHNIWSKDGATAGGPLQGAARD